MTPGAAIFQTLLLPGLAHLRLGRGLRGALAFLTTVGAFWTGYAIVGERIWYFVLFEPFSILKPVLDIVPVQLLPESPNLGCSTVAALLRSAPTNDLLREMRAPVPLEHLGLFLTGASGVLCALWACDAHWLAQGRRALRPTPPMAAMLSWFLPGAGHLWAGQKSKGILVGAAVVLIFVLGLLLSHGHAVDRPQLSAWWIGQVLFGGGALFSTFVTAPLQYTEIPAMFDHGVAFCTVAGFLNLIVMIDAYTVAERSGDDSRHVAKPGPLPGSRPAAAGTGEGA